MNSDTTTKTTTGVKPPYVTYTTFSNFIKSLRASTIPNRIDRSVLVGLSGTNQGFLLSALRFLELIKADGTPTASLKDIVANPANERAVLSDQVYIAYAFVLNDSFNIQAATQAELDEVFRKKGLAGETLNKATSFFSLLCQSVGIQLSPHLRGKSSSANGNGGASTPTRRRTVRRRSNNDAPPAQIPAQSLTLEQQLISKFPAFDPNWPDDLKTKWFASFDQFSKLVKQQSGNGEVK